ncbi:Hypothetical protein PHPALM_17152 [Phytophthora palmivora]|uniref:DDE-1 domain-containing protein n=1 Tax=Phytophthora palmivora TaxID=4796 RepID=A0A2P4XN14_9STRA|nr:Hypothetical protein PHPALM_17152 [Phytophthora palmivora]
MGRKQRGYSIKEKLAAVELIELVGLSSAVEDSVTPHGTVHGWWTDRIKLRAYNGNKLAKTLNGQARKETFPFTPALVTFIKVTFFISIQYLTISFRQKLQETKLPSVDLIRIKTEFALNFWINYNAYSPSEIYNVDETAIQFDMPLKYETDSPALLLADNFHCHVSDEGVRVVANEARATVVPLPPKSTSVCQPLDVGVMGPLKTTIRSLYVPKKGLSVPEKRLRAIETTIAAWENFPINSVIRSFEAAIPRNESTSV